VFGWRAGKRAAELAKDHPDLRARPSDVDRLIGEPLARLREGKGPHRPADLLRPLQQKMWEQLLVEKDAPTLADALAYLADDRQRLETAIHVAEPMDYALALEHRNLLDVAEVIIRAAQLRTESRGSHYRSDFPNRDDANWLANIVVTRREGALELRKGSVNEEAGWLDQPGDVRILPWG
jgi:succinate dehydrogenase/fumarate reductase flavoprotein subunit